MSNQDDKIIGFMKRQIVVENEIVNSVSKGLKNIKNPAVRGVLKGI